MYLAPSSCVMGCRSCGSKYRNLLMEYMSYPSHLTFGIATDSASDSDAGSFLPQGPSTFNGAWFNHRPELLGIPAYPHNLQVPFSSGAYYYPSGSRPSMLSTQIQNIDEAARAIVLESLIADSVIYHDEGSSSAHSPDQILQLGFSQTPPIVSEVFGPLPVISNDSVASYRDVLNCRQEGESMNVPSESDTTSNSESSVPSIPSEISHAPAAIPYQEQRASRDQSRQFRKRGKESAVPSSRSSRQPTNTHESPKGPYLCNACSKPFSQRQGLGRHRREKHDARLCKHCGEFKWGRPYLLRKHLKEKHPDIDPDTALEEARGGRMSRNSHTRSTQNNGICLPTFQLNTTEGTALNPSPIF